MNRSEFIQMNSRSGGDGFTNIHTELRSGNGEEFPFPTGFMEQFGFVPPPTSGTPLLSEESSIPSLNHSFPGLPRSVTFSPSADYENNPQIYCFHIRDTSGCLLIKGSVRKQTGSVELQSTTGATFLFMVTSGSPNSSGGRSAAAGTQYEVRHQNKLLGKVSLSSTGSSFQMSNSVEKMSYSVHSISKGDISICRSTSGSPICTIHMDSSFLQTSFSGSLVLPSQVPATRVEQCLCIAVAIAYTVDRNKEKEVEEVQAAERAPMESMIGCLLAVGVLFLICFGLWGIIKILASSTCSSRYRERPNVKSKGCTSDGYPDWI